MPSLDSLPGDQRAVLQLVLGRGRSYNEIAGLLSIDPVAVRDRALAALSALGPQTGVSPESRGTIADYLLGQLSDQSEIDAARDLLARSPRDRAWARVVSSELAPLTSEALPEIPTEASDRRSEPAHPAPSPEPEAEPREAAGSPTGLSQPETAPPAAAGRSFAPATEEAARGPHEGKDGNPDGGRRSSRLGGALVIAVAVVAVAAVLFFVLRSGGSSPKRSTVAASTTSTAAAASGGSTTSSGSSTTPAKVVAQVNLTPPHSGSKAAGIAEVLNEGSRQGVAIVAQNVPPNSTKPPNAYAVWLYNSPQDAQILGFVNPGVGSNGRLSTAGALPSNASHFKHLVVTVETTAKPKAPGMIILQGPLTRL
ncbi:MAG TPA: hypothetical protein VG365_17460 [Solirubrobacteraceae bacterium]|jgi:hypothetical protein|nr:hypothetical protein [Solirubrobacteraceae bacterium]